MTTLTEPGRYDLNGRSAVVDPYPAYHAVRAAGPLVSVGGAWYVTTYELADAVLKHSSFGRGEYRRLIDTALGPGPLQDSISRWMLYLDPPAHSRLRSLVMRAFTPRAVNRLRDTIQEIVDGLLDGLDDRSAADGRGVVDFLAEFAYPLPVHAICRLLGVPAQDRADFRRWSADLGRGLQIATATPEVTSRGNAAAAGLGDYFRGLVADRRRVPAEGFLDDLIAAEDEGGRLSDDELLATVVMLFFAGHETTVNLLGNGMTAMLAARTEWEAVCADPALARQAVEEMLRFDTPVQRATRVALTDVELAGTPIPKGTLVNILIAGANRDPVRFPDPDRFSVRRADGPHLAFAAGAHYCVGATLARAEAEIAVATIARRFPDIRLASDDLRYRPNLILRGLESVPVTLRSPATG
ncbi:hypothetical protein BJF78_23815 [Pseudonocardia sp. CNS-139]|nr:hypothetical protein BJF78_23815 [Pseudonocardia sp. CNS-139]